MLLRKQNAGFEQEIQAYAIHVLSLTYQKVPRAVLAEVGHWYCFLSPYCAMSFIYQGRVQLLLAGIVLVLLRNQCLDECHTLA